MHRLGEESLCTGCTDWEKRADYILNMPNLVSGVGALEHAARLSDSTVLVSAGSITPSSHNLHIQDTGHKATLYKLLEVIC